MVGRKVHLAVYVCSYVGWSLGLGEWLFLSEWRGKGISMALLVSDLRSLVAASKMSPEQLADPLQISPMTLRRLLKRPETEALTDAYETLVDEGVYRLIIDGKLAADNEVAAKILSKARLLSFGATIHALGFSETAMAQGVNMDDRVIIGLSQIGSSADRQSAVLEGRSSMGRIEQMSKAWGHKLRTLWKVLASSELSTFEKFAAYGALFYVLAPADLIPDTIPVFGLVDDFAMVSIVAGYYLSRFPGLFA
jgi:uncharacterized membrane protein YkvA (DUF1232 family)